MVRTGLFDQNGIEKQDIIKHLFFFKIFFPPRGFFNWDFNSPVVKTKLRSVLYKFVVGQDNPRRHIQDVRDYKDQLDLL